MLNLVKLNNNFHTTEQYRKSLETEEYMSAHLLYTC